jgi:2-hydroxychromene-2-carboxylate isomerase
VRRGPRVHFSFRSPYSWMAFARLLRRVPDAHERLELIPYWDPDVRTRADLQRAGAEFHYAQMKKAKHLYILHDTRRQAIRLGLRMVWPIDDDPWWELPHLGWLLARRLGFGEQFFAAVMAARWERGENVCDEKVIREIGAQVGVDGDLLMAAPDSTRIRAEGVDCLVAAYEDDIFGVPYFRIGRHRFWGLDRVDAFVAELLGEAVSQPPDMTEPPLRVCAYDTDTAGGCG